MTRTDVERWDAWANLADLLPPPTDVPDLAGPFPPPEPGEAAVLRLAAAANAQFADGLAGLVAGRHLRLGRRVILPHVGMSALHRHGLERRQAGLARIAARALDPHAGLRGWSACEDARVSEVAADTEHDQPAATPPD